MNFDKNKTYYCFGCSDYTSTLHELVFGNLYRRLSIQYHIQVPLCVVCHHKWHHGKEKYQLRDQALNYLGTDFKTVIKAYQHRNFRHTLEVGMEERQNKIQKLEV